MNSNEVNEIHEFGDLDNKKHNSSLVKSLTKNGVRILNISMWVLSAMFIAYIARYLWLTATAETSTIADNMQDIIVKVSGWVLFVLSQVGIIKRKKNQE